MKKRTSILTFIALTITALSAVQAVRADEEKKIEISGGDTMKFDVTAIEANAGQKVTLTLKNTGKIPMPAMGHNFVLLKAGTDAAAFANAGMTHPAEGYIAPEMADKVIAHTKVLGPGESDTITFTAPAAGKYDYICSFPAHAIAGMKGVMTVK